MHTASHGMEPTPRKGLATYHHHHGVSNQLGQQADVAPRVVSMLRSRMDDSIKPTL